MQDDLETFQRLSQGIKGEDCETSYGLRPGCNCDVLFLIHLIYWALFTHTCSPRGKNNSGLGMQFPFLRTTRQRTTAITSVTMADVIVGGGDTQLSLSSTTLGAAWLFPCKRSCLSSPFLLHLINHTWCWRVGTIPGEQQGTTDAYSLNIHGHHVNRHKWVQSLRMGNGHGVTEGYKWGLNYVKVLFENRWRKYSKILTF